MPDLPTFFNGGAVLLVLLALVIFMAWAAHRPLRWRCPVCGTRFPDESLLDAHERRHASRPSRSAA